MSKHRKQKKARSRRPGEVRETYTRLLTALGLLDDFRTLDPDVRSHILSSVRLPRFRVDIDSSLRDDPLAGVVKRDLEKIISDATFDDGPLGPGCSLQDYFSIVIPFGSFWRDLGNDAPVSAEVVERFRRATAPVREATFIEALSCRLAECSTVLWANSRITDKVYYIAHKSGSDLKPDKISCLSLRSQMPEQLWLDMDGVSRPVFRCGIGTMEGLGWVSWQAGALQLPAGPPSLPVYIQSHAVEKLRERVQVFEGDERMASRCYSDFLAETMCAPQFISQGNNSWLVEFTIFGRKVGYMAASLVGDKIIIKTFLFVTMDNTPEGRRLNQRLRLTRADKEHLGLDTLNAFLVTDITKDPGLSAILQECGCGHLVALARMAKVDGPCSEHAQYVRKYLRMPILREMLKPTSLA